MNAWELTKLIENQKHEIVQLIDKKRKTNKKEVRDLIDEEINRKENIIFGVIEVLRGVNVE